MSKEQIKITLPTPISQPQRDIITAFENPVINFIIVVCGRR